MRGSLVAIATMLLLAGCLAGPRSPPAASLPARPDLSAFAACPQLDNRTIPCDGQAKNPLLAPVTQTVPPAWTCVTFSDKRMWPTQPYPFPDWYTYVGPPPQGDGPRATGTEMGIRYDTHSDKPVAGILQVRSDSDTQFYDWVGPAAGFVRVPTPLQDNQLYFGAIMWPAKGGPEPLRPDPNATGASRNDLPLAGFQLNATGFPVESSSAFFSLRDLGGGAGQWAWQAALNLQSDGQTYHFPFQEGGWNLGGPDPRSEAGTAHWGQARNRPYNATVQGKGWEVHAALQPWMAFFGQVRDVTDPSLLAASAYQCACLGKTPLTLEGVECLTGIVPPPTLQLRPDGFDVGLGDAPQAEPVHLPHANS